MSELSAKDLWSQLKKRKVVRVALVYLIIVWLIILVGVVAFDGLGVPRWVLPLLMALFLLGFPIVLVLAWVYEITPHGIRKDTAGDIESITKFRNPSDTTPSVAVLPFEDLSENGDQEYLCKGLAEEILDTLRKIRNLRVASRMTAFQLRSEDTDVKEVGRKLHVQAGLKGGVRKTGENLYITAELVNTTDGSLLWSHQYDRPFKEVFVIQEKIVKSIAKALDISIKNKKSLKRQHVGPKAYDLFLHGLSCFARHTTQDNVLARQLFIRTIDLEPEFGRAWAALAYTYGYSYMYFNATDVNLAEAKRTSAQALKLAPHLAEPHVSSGIACCMNQNYKKAETEFEKAIELDPKNFRAWYFYGRAKVHEGDLERALKLFERASMVRPEDFQSVLLQAQLYTSLGQRGKALEVTRLGIERVRAVLDLNPDNNRALNMGAFALLRLGQGKEARKWMSTSIKNAPMDSIIQYNGACFFSLAGDVEHALDCLENCLIKVGSINREWLTHDSDMDNIRDHPRYEDVIRSFPE
jgi:adenylate cyclase